MVRKIISFIIVGMILLSFTYTSEGKAASAPIGVKWGNSILIPGQIGKVTILQDSNLYKLNSNGELIYSRKLLKGNEYRVYSYLSSHGGLYGVGGGMYVKKAPSQVKYETPSPIKKQQIQRILFFDQQLLTLAQQGILKGQPISADGTHDIKEVYEHFQNIGGGAPIPKVESIGDSLAHTFKMYTYYTYYPYNNNVQIIDWNDDSFVPITPYVIRELLGNPEGEEKSEIDGKWIMRYKTGNFNLYVTFRGDNGSQLDYLRLKKN
ncbi:hypothetical protein [Cytobacillus pseudoceanisediminis]|uniref:hypothetical protein n=1 Tax=Cytobacillus pseudoceanisediminis TaxID=3051614 RepID=UPI003C2BE474